MVAGFSGTGLSTRQPFPPRPQVALPEAPQEPVDLRGLDWAKNEKTIITEHAAVRVANNDEEE